MAYVNVKPTNVNGYIFDGSEPDDDFILRMARIGVVVDYTSDKDNDHEGSSLVLTQVLPGGATREYTYEIRHQSVTKLVIWTEIMVGDKVYDGRIIEAWDRSQSIQWSREDE